MVGVKKRGRQRKGVDQKENNSGTSSSSSSDSSSDSETSKGPGAKEDDIVMSEVNMAD